MARRKHKTIYKKERIVLLALIVLGLWFVLANLSNLYSYSSAVFHDYENKNYTFGIDVSHYQEVIDWNEVRSSRHPIQFAFIRSSMGSNRKDKRFLDNWIGAKANNIIRGAYHFYDPNENSKLQANNFINTVKLDSGDLPPVLDVELMSRYGTDNLMRGIKNWLKLIERHYNCKPIIYTGYRFYEEHLMDDEDFDSYPLWIAAYNKSKSKMSAVDWNFHQFTEKVKVEGVKSRVDGNDFKGSKEDLIKLCLK